MTPQNSTTNIVGRGVPIIRGFAAALAVAVYWSLVETIIIRHLFPSGFYYSRSFATALNGRTIFYGIISLALWILIAIVVRLVRSLRSRETAVSVVAARASLILASVAAWVNLNIVAAYIVYTRLEVPFKSRLLYAGLTGVLTLALVTGAVLFITRWGQRLGRAKKPAQTLVYIFCGAALTAGVLSHGSKYYRSGSRPVPSPSPDVVLITLDAWRADTLSPRLSPAIFEFARANGVIFTHARSTAPCTLQSFAGAFTGSYNITRSNSLEYRRNLRPTWAEVMWIHGYDTYAIISNPYLDTVRLLHRGFVSFDYADFNSLLSKLHFYDTAWYYVLRGSMFKPEVPGTTSGRLTAKALAVLRTPSSRPKFVWVHYLDPHYPYQPTSQVLKEKAPGLLDKTDLGTNRGKLAAENVDDIKALYDYEVTTTDRYVADLLAELSRRPRTLVIFFSDHGEEFMEHGHFEHRKTVYDEVTRVPLVISMPEEDRERLARLDPSTPISLIDLAPSVLDYLGFPVPPTMEGYEKLLAGEAPPNRGVFSTLRHPNNYFYASVVNGGKKAIIKIEGATTSFEYYDLNNDPLELEAIPFDAEGEDLKKILEAWVADRVNLGEDDLGEKEMFGDRADLKALGYL